MSRKKEAAGIFATLAPLRAAQGRSVSWEVPQAWDEVKRHDVTDLHLLGTNRERSVVAPRAIIFLIREST